MSTVRRVDAGRRGPLLLDAAMVVMLAQYAHRDLIQRRVRVGFATAGILLDLLEEAGVIGPMVPGVKRRRVLVAREDAPAALEVLSGKADRKTAEQVRILRAATDG